MKHKQLTSDQINLSLLDSIDAIIYVADFETYELLFLNKKAQDLFGAKIGEKCWKVLQADQTGPCDFCTNDRLLNADGTPVEPYIWEFQNTINGEWWECRDQAVKWADGRLVRLEIATNITEQKVLRDKLQESEQKFRLLADFTHDWEYWIDPKGNYIYISPSCEKITGYSPEEFTANPQLLLDITVKEDAQRVHHHYVYEGVRDRPPITMEFKIITKNGEERCLEHYCSPAFDEEGQFVGRRGNNRDITIRKKAEEKLIASELRLSMALKGAKCGLWDWLIPEKKVYFDANYYRISGYPPYDFPQSFAEWEKRVHPEDITAAKLELQKYLNKETASYSVEFRFKKKSGEWMWLLAQGEIVEWAKDGSPLRLSGLHIDIDDSKNAELKRLELEQQLRQKFKMEAVGTMAGGMAHNFNNSLAIILGSMEMAQRKIDDKLKVEKYIQSAAAAALSSRDLVQQILNYSRQENQEKKPVRVSLILDDIQKMLRPTIPTSIKLSYEVSSECTKLTVEANSGQIQEAVLNLCNNAVHSMGDKGTLRISLDQIVLKQQDIPAQFSCSAGTFARISVQDTGCGIDQKIMSKVFDPFFTTKGVNEGTGIGLSSVRGIIEQHDGLVKVQSTLNQGSTFELYFPVTHTTPAVEVADITDLPGGTERILLVDDEDNLLEVCSQMLIEMGYRVTTETSSQRALDIIKAAPQQFDILITDQTMPDLTGIDLAQEVKKLNAQLPIILCTGFSNQVSADDAEDFGINIFCPKPLKMSELAKAIRAVLDEQ